MRTSHRLTVALILLAVVAWLPAEPVAAQTGESSLTANSLDGHLLIEGSPSEVAAVALPCAAIHRAIGEYNETLPEDEIPIPTPNTTKEQFELLRFFFTPPGDDTSTFDYSDTVLEFCTQVNKDGWYPANDGVLGRIGSDSIRITTTLVGPVACTNPGQILMVQSAYFFTGNGWQWEYGTDWAEDYAQGTVIYSTDLSTICMDLIPGGAADFLDVATRVPTAQVNYNPTIRGLTGLATWLWYDFDLQDSYLLELNAVRVDARGTSWFLDMTAWVDRVSWDIDCETGCDYRGTQAAFDDSGYEYTLDLEDFFDLSIEPAVLAPADVYDGGAASDNDAAASHLYRTKGDYVVSTATVWRGYYEFDGIIYPYTPVVVADSVDYQVIEVRSRLVTPVP